ncbi:putative ATP-dependent endonuclease of OLD family [Palleronia aestuarii]|uniref:Putative ATP-dependent endonuclease of OLD family n=1 Tax=Palleronia aestuarii TaxID=568105 RepID=A0A2W7NBW3_9RHOB|nr:AAA family ATPase [Palleronia aestuarii]PZX14214.1 putative ATP-dependent endonuclease of OLD family [Palleronia aestuarii]
MHHISEVRIQNFKSISDGFFPLSHYTPLVGYNNVGKTNIIRAVGWIIKRSSLSAEDFHRADQPVVVEAEISGITGEVLNAIGDAHRGRIEPLVVDDRIRIRRIQTTPGQTAAAIRFEVLRRENGQNEWAVNPAGIDPAIGALFPDPIFIGAMENATEDVAKFGSGTTIGKLLKEIMTPVIDRHSPAVAAALQDIEQRLSANAAEKDETLVDLDGRIQGELSKLFPGVSAKTHIPVPEFADFMKLATIRIFEEGYENPDGRDASSFGHGAQRSIQIALVKCLAEVRRAGGGNAGRTTLLLIDEPELYLHPQAVEVVRAALSRLAGDGYQVVITTHSANMISRSDAPSALLIRRTAADGTKCNARIKDAVKNAIHDADHQSDALFALSNSSKILFSERVGITEGKTERTILPAIFQEEFGLTPDEDKIGLVDIGGTPNIPDTMKVLNAMGVPCKAIVDLDFAFRIAPIKALLDREHADLASCKVVLAELRDDGHIGLDAEGLPMKHNGAPAAAAFELLAMHHAAMPCIVRLHEELKALGVWMWTKGAIEAHLGIAKTGAAQRAFMDGLADDDYRAAIPDYQSVRDAMAWLRA